MIQKKTCVICGKDFYSNIANRITCSPACAKKRKQQTEKERRSKGVAVLETKVCPECGKTFMPRSGQQMFCSKRCAERHRRAARYGDKQEPARIPAKGPSLMDRWAAAFKRGETNKTYGGWVAEFYLAKQKQKEENNSRGFRHET